MDYGQEIDTTDEEPTDGEETDEQDITGGGDEKEEPEDEGGEEEHLEGNEEGEEQTEEEEGGEEEEGEEKEDEKEAEEMREEKQEGKEDTEKKDQQEKDEGKLGQEEVFGSEELKGKIDDNTMKQLEKAEKEAKQAAEAIYELKNRIKELLQIAQMTQEQAVELEEKNTELVMQMVIFDQKTKEIQDIIAKSQILDAMPERQPQVKHEEDVLPRVILCGFDEDYVPKIVVCDQKTKGRAGGSRSCSSDCPGPSPPSCEPSSVKASKLYCDDFDEKDRKIAASNAEIARMKCLLEDDITNKDRMLSELQLKLAELETEIRMVSTENATLDERIRKLQMSQKVGKCTVNNRRQEQKKKICPIAMEAKLKEYAKYTSCLESTLADMEKDFDQVLKEVKAAKKAREKLNNDTDPYCRKSCR